MEKCNYCNDLARKPCPQTKETYKDGWIIRTEYKCKNCQRIIYEEIE